MSPMTITGVVRKNRAVHFNKPSCILISNLAVSVLIVQSDKTNGGTDKGRDIHLKRAFKQERLRGQD